MIHAVYLYSFIELVHGTHTPQHEVRLGLSLTLIDSNVVPITADINSIKFLMGLNVPWCAVIIIYQVVHQINTDIKKKQIVSKELKLRGFPNL